MCTLSYLPNSDGYFLVNNRDENPQRARAIEPKIITENNINVLAPIDAEANGTWIGINHFGNFVCLMNGAFQPHKRMDTYAKSRGIIAKDFLFSKDTNLCFEEYNLEEIEPFTIIQIDNQKMMEYRWDGLEKYSKKIDETKAQIWSSATLYSEAIAQERKEYFENQAFFFQNHQTELINWHKNKIENAPSILLQKQNVQTVSITTILKKNEEIILNYEDLLQQNSIIQKLELL